MPSSSSHLSSTSSYKYIFKFIIIGDMGVGKSCLMQRFTEDKFRNDLPHTIGVEFGTSVITINDEKVKLQIWDTAGQERFRSITRGYYRGAAGAVLVYDITRRDTFNHVLSWLEDAEANVNPHASMILIGNKADLVSSSSTATSTTVQPSLPSTSLETAPKAKSVTTTKEENDPSKTEETRKVNVDLEEANTTIHANQINTSEQEKSSQVITSANVGHASNNTVAHRQREVSYDEGRRFAEEHKLLFMECSALTGDHVRHAFLATAAKVHERVMCGIISPTDPDSGVQLHATSLPLGANLYNANTNSKSSTQVYEKQQNNNNNNSSSRQGEISGRNTLRNNRISVSKEVLAQRTAASASVSSASLQSGTGASLNNSGCGC